MTLNESIPEPSSENTFNIHLCYIQLLSHHRRDDFTLHTLMNTGLAKRISCPSGSLSNQAAIIVFTFVPYVKKAMKGLLVNNRIPLGRVLDFVVSPYAIC